jgi:hypothetical protein
VEWSFEPERLSELRATSSQTSGRELLDLSKAWLRPPFIAETSLRLPLGISLVLLVLTEALLARTGWKLPQLAPPKRAAREPRIKILKPKQAGKEVILPKPATQSEFTAPPAVEESKRSARFQRAKDKK